MTNALFSPRTMSLFLLLTTAALFAASPVSADDYDQNDAAVGTSKGVVAATAKTRRIVSIAVYDANCEKVPFAVRAMAEKAMTVIPPETLRAVQPRVKADYAAAGAFRWCDLTKAMIERAVANFNR